MKFLTPILVSLTTAIASAEKPNIIIIVTDDQGYGEIAAHGNPIIKTPHLDALHAESIRFTDFHVDPTCSPTRAAILTGRYSTRTGVWHTINGRSMMRPEELTLAEILKANGYQTSFVGKWHLGDNHPCRPDDQGYDHTYWHQGGGLDNGPAYWGNDYYDDTIKSNGEWVQLNGYCTDAWFDEAIRIIEQPRDAPFFLTLHTNAPHGPFIVPDAYAAPYRQAGLSDTMAIFYGMITCIDDNIGRLRKRLTELNLADNTLLLLTTDNGTAAGWITHNTDETFYNAGMRGWKSSAYDGGHRVPLFIHWPKGGLTGGRGVSALTAHIDLVPTFIDLLNLKKTDGPPLDGISFSPLLLDPSAIAPDRHLFVHVQRRHIPPKWTNSAVMTTRWRLIDGKELYDIKADPGQQNDLASQHPETVSELTQAYETWWKSLEADRRQTVRYVLGGKENPMTLNSHDWLMDIGERDAVWHQNQIRRGEIGNGPWAVEIGQQGTYEISLHRWPPYLEKPMGIVEARLRIGDEVHTASIGENATKATFQIKLSPGPTLIKTWLRRPGPERLEHGAYYLEVTHLAEP